MFRYYKACLNQLMIAQRYFGKLRVNPCYKGSIRELESLFYFKHFIQHVYCPLPEFPVIMKNLMFDHNMTTRTFRHWTQEADYKWMKAQKEFESSWMSLQRGMH